MTNCWNFETYSKTQKLLKQNTLKIHCKCSNKNLKFLLPFISGNFETYFNTKKGRQKRDIQIIWGKPLHFWKIFTPVLKTLHPLQKWWRWHLEGLHHTWIIMCSQRIAGVLLLRWSSVIQWYCRVLASTVYCTALHCSRVSRTTILLCLGLQLYCV